MSNRDLNIPERLNGQTFGYPVKAGVRIYGRSLIALTASGLAVPVDHPDAVAFAGIAIQAIDNLDGIDGATKVTVRRDVRGFNFAATPADLNKTVYASNNEVLSLEANVGLRVGVIVGLDDGRVWIDLSK